MFTRILLVALLSWTLSAHAATFQAGKSDQPGGGSASATENGAASALSDDQILQRLWSPKSFEASAALKALSQRLPQLAGTGKVTPAAMERVIALLSDDSPGVRGAAEEMIRNHGALLFHENLLTQDMLDAKSQAAHDSTAALSGFTALLNALLPEQGANHVKSEYVFQALDALVGSDPTAASTAAKMLSREGVNLARNGAWKIEHTQNFLLKFKEADAPTRRTMMPVLKANLNEWVNDVFITKADFTGLLEAVFAGKDVDLTQDVLDFMSDAKTGVTLSKLQVFDRAWADSLIAGIQGADNARKQASLNLLTNLLKPFALSKSFTGADFRAVWGTVFANLDAFDAPFELVSKNIGPLTKAGWFTQSDYGALLKAFPERPLGEQKDILKFVDSSYAAFNERGWITATPFLPVLFGETSSGELERLRTKFLVNHSDLVTEKRLLGREELPQFLRLLRHKDGTVRQAAVQIADQGLDEWATEGIISPETMRSLVETEPADFRSADIIELIDKHFPVLAPLFTKPLAESLSEIAFSPNEDVTVALKDFFAHNVPLMKKKGLFTSKVRGNLQKSGLWEELPKKAKKGAGARGTKLR